LQRGAHRFRWSPFREAALVGVLDPHPPVARSGVARLRRGGGLEQLDLPHALPIIAAVLFEHSRTALRQPVRKRFTKFGGSAVVFVSTVTFYQRTAALQ
jgi:hypothetical protein